MTRIIRWAPEKCEKPDKRFLLLLPGLFYLGGRKPVMEQDEADLLHRLAQGDQRALQQLFDQHYVALCRVALRLVHRPEVAEEIVQDVFVYLWEKRGDWQINTSAGAYLARAVRNRCLNHLKSRASRYDWSEDIQDDQHPTDAAPDDALRVTELTAALEHILPQLPERCQLVFSLIRYEERSYQEVADQLGVSVKAIEYHMGKALRLIRQHLVRYGYGLGAISFFEFFLGEGFSFLS